MSTPSPAPVRPPTWPPMPAGPPAKPPYDLPERALHGMVLTLSRPAADEPDSAWRETVQVALDRLGELDPRDPLEAMLAIQVIAAEAGALDAYRLAMEPGTTAAQAQRRRASATGMVRAVTGLMRALTRQRLVPMAPARDWGDAAAALAGAWQAAPARPAEAGRGATAEAAEPPVIVRWIDEIDDAELAIAVEADRREKAGEPPLPTKPGPKVLYR